MKLIDRIKGFFGSQEGSLRGPFYAQGELGGWHQLGSLEDGFQRNLELNGLSARHIAPVYACVMLNARAISQCSPKHMVGSADGSFAPSTTSPASRVLHRPNSYETWAQFILNVVCGMLFDGEVLCLKVRDNRFAVTALHRVPRGTWSIHIAPESKEIYYGISDGELYDQPEMLIPAREVVHFRMHTPRNPLVGESPIKAAAMAAGINVALNRSQMQFFTQMNRPSGVLSTDLQLNADQMKMLRTAFDEQSKTWSQGGLPILSAGLKFQPMGVAQNDAQLIEQQKLSIADIARVFGVPMALLADSAGPQAGTESQITHWLSVGLGSIIENIERSLDVAFDLSATEHIQLDPTPLLRVDFAGRIDGISKAVQNGIITINEARLKEGFAPVQNGDQPVLQQQMTPLNLLAELHASTIASKVAPAEPKDPAEEDPEPSKEIDPQVTKALIVSLLDRKRRAA
jgi:HK97 family phage portal protein